MYADLCPLNPAIQTSTSHMPTLRSSYAVHENYGVVDPSTTCRAALQVFRKELGFGEGLTISDCNDIDVLQARIWDCDMQQEWLSFLVVETLVTAWLSWCSRAPVLNTEFPSRSKCQSSRSQSVTCRFVNSYNICNSGSSSCNNSNNKRERENKESAHVLRDRDACTDIHTQHLHFFLAVCLIFIFCTITIIVVVVAAVIVVIFSPTWDRLGPGPAVWATSVQYDQHQGTICSLGDCACTVGGSARLIPPVGCYGALKFALFGSLELSVALH